MSNSLAFRLLIVVALLCAQAGGLIHGISHVADGRLQSGVSVDRDDQSAPSQKHCDLCDAYAQIASAVGSSVTVFIPASIPDAVAPGLFYSHFSAVAVPFAARAPPHSA